MNNLKFLSLIGYAPTILKPEVNNYVIFNVLPSFAHSPTIFTCNYTLTQRLYLNCVQSPSLPAATTLTQPLTRYQLFVCTNIWSKCCAYPLFLPPFTTFRVKRSMKGRGNSFLSGLTPFGGFPALRFTPFGGITLRLFPPLVGRNKGKNKKYERAQPKGRVRERSWVRVRKFVRGWYGPSSYAYKGCFWPKYRYSSLKNVFTKSLRKRISYWTLMLQFNRFIFLIKKIVQKQIANLLLIKKLNFLLLTFFKYIGFLSLDFWKGAKIGSVLTHTGCLSRSSNPRGAAKRSCPSGVRVATYSIKKRDWVSNGWYRVSKAPIPIEMKVGRFPSLPVKGSGFFCPGVTGVVLTQPPLSRGCLLSYPEGVSLTNLGHCLLFRATPNPSKGLQVTRLVRQKVIPDKRVHSRYRRSCSIKSFKKISFEFSRYLKVYLYKILWKWVQKRDHTLSPITLIGKYWIFIQNNAKFYTLK